MGVPPCPIPGYFETAFVYEVAFLGCQWPPGVSAVGAVGTDGLLLSSWGRSIPQKTSSSVKGR